MNEAAVVPLTIFLTLHPHSFCRAWNLVSKLVEVLRSLSVLLEVLTCSGQGSRYSFKAHTFANTHKQTFITSPFWCCQSYKWSSFH